jgi:taurine dioxygenase
LFDEIHRLWLEHLVLFFPAQQLTPDAHIELARRFGEPEIHQYLPKLDDDHQEIVVLDSDTGVRADFWHTDVAFSPTPPKASILQIITTPPFGGDTIWSNQYAAYDTLSAPMRELLDGLTAVHDAGSHGDPDNRAEHPAIRVHPETGRRALFVNGTSTSHFVELERHESDALLAMLLRWCEHPKFHCRYRWGPGDVAIWDNRCTQHHAVNDYGDTRVGRRVTVIGDVPVGP